VFCRSSGSPFQISGAYIFKEFFLMSNLHGYVKRCDFSADLVAWECIEEIFVKSEDTPLGRTEFVLKNSKIICAVK